MEKTIFKINKMDCPSEENLIRLKLGDIKNIEQLDFDIDNRQLTIFHKGGISEIETKISSLNLDSSLEETIKVTSVSNMAQANQRNVLIAVLLINFTFFGIEMVTGLLSKSMGLVADSLDMLADAFVYGISLYAVGSSMARKKNIALTAGYFQLTLAIIGFVEVLRRVFFADGVPDFITMVIVSAFALLANAGCLTLLQKSKGKEEAHMKASLIFTSNDVIINLGVILAATLVYFLESSIPDLVIGSIVFVLVIRGALRILQLGK